MAGEFGISADEVMGLLRQMDVHVRSHLSPLTDDQVARVRARWEREKRVRAEKQAAPAAPARRRRGAVSKVAAVAEPVRDVTFILYEAEEIESEFNGLSKLSVSDPDLMRADFAILMEPSDGVVEAGCQGTMRVEVTTYGERAHSARAWRGCRPSPPRAVWDRWSPPSTSAPRPRSR